MLTREQAAAMDTDWRDRREARVVEAIESFLRSRPSGQTVGFMLRANDARRLTREVIRAYEGRP